MSDQAYLVSDWKMQISQNPEFYYNFESVNIERAFQISGGFGRYQKIVVYFFFLYFFFNNMFFYAVPYWYYQPDFLCLQSNGTYVSCTKQQACLTSTYKLEILRKSIITDFHLECTDHEQEILTKIFTIVGIMCLLMNVIVDIKGRKMAFLFLNFFGYFLGGLFGYFGSKLWHYSLANTLIMINVNCGFLLAITFQAESLPNHERQQYGLYNSFMIAVGGTLFCISQYWVKDYRTIYLVLIWYQVVFLLFCYWV